MRFETPKICDSIIKPTIYRFFFSERLKAMIASEGTYYIIVVENTEVGNIVASGSLVIEQKFIRDTALVRSLYGILLPSTRE